mmetsp:Transcript_3918/g.8434  ORF Transcript_3918/g.8434 Transcript_3918/m.8434 type:complete len:111 (-) Transcript_3918:1008-1340(-)
MVPKEKAEGIPRQDHEEDNDNTNKEHHQENIPNGNLAFFCEGLAKDRVDNIDKRIHLQRFEVFLEFFDKIIDGGNEPLEELPDNDRQKDSNRKFKKNLYDFHFSTNTDVE